LTLRPLSPPAVALAPPAAPAAPIVLELRGRADYLGAVSVILAMSDGHRPLQPVVVQIVEPVGLPSVLHLGEAGEGLPVDLTLDGGGHRLRRCRVSLAGRRVVVRDLHLEPEGLAGDALVVDATQAVELHNLSVTGAGRAPPGRGPRGAGRSVLLSASGPSVRVVAEGVSVLDAGSPGSVVLMGQGQGSFGEVDWVEGRFGGNIDPTFVTGGVTLIRARGTQHMGAGRLLSALPSTLLLEDWTEVPASQALLDAWRQAARGALGAPG
jgi:hypothetical protein